MSKPAYRVTWQRGHVVVRDYAGIFGEPGRDYSFYTRGPYIYWSCDDRQVCHGMSSMGPTIMVGPNGHELLSIRRHMRRAAREWRKDRAAAGCCR